MNARRLLVLGLTIGLLLSLAPAAAGAPSKQQRAKRTCATQGQTVERNEKARVYEVGLHDDYKLYGCELRDGKRRLLASWFSCQCSIGDDTAPDVSLSGRFVALTRVSCSPIDAQQPCKGSLAVIDLRSGRAVHRTSDPVGNVLLRPTGSVVYMASEGLIRHDANGTVVLDPGPIEPHSVATSRWILYWTSGGAARSAPFQ